MNPAKLVRYSSALLASALLISGSSTASALTNTYVTAIQTELTAIHAGALATASLANLNYALRVVIGANATSKAYAAYYLNGVLANRTDAATIDASVSLTALNAAGTLTAGANTVMLYAISYATDKTALLTAMATNQKDAVLDTLAKGAVQSAAGNTATANGYLSAILNAPGKILTDTATFASTAISAAPTNTNMAKTVAELVATKVAVASQAAFAKSLASKVSYTLAPSIAIGVAHSAPVGSYGSITASVVLANANTIANSPAIAGAMAGSMSLEYSTLIAYYVGANLRTNTTYGTLAPQIAKQIALKIEAKNTSNGGTSTNADCAQEIASEAYTLIYYLVPSNLANQTKITAVVTQVAQALGSTSYSDAVVGSLYKALKTAQPNAKFLSAVYTAFMSGLPAAEHTGAYNAIVAVNNGTDTFKTGNIPVTHSAFVTD